MTLQQYMRPGDQSLDYQDGYSSAVAWYEGESDDRDPPDWADEAEWVRGWVDYEMGRV